MADLVLKRNDTYPYLRGKAEDSNGLLELDKADSLKIILKDGATIIEGVAEVLEEDSEGMNWQYKWEAGDTALAGEYKVELEITWDGGASPPQIDTVPNNGYATVEIQEDLA